MPTPNVWLFFARGAREGGAGMVRETRRTASEGGHGASAARGDGGRVVCHRAGSDGEEHREIRKGTYTKKRYVHLKVHTLKYTKRYIHRKVHTLNVTYTKRYMH